MLLIIRLPLQPRLTVLWIVVALFSLFSSLCGPADCLCQTNVSIVRSEVPLGLKLLCKPFKTRPGSMDLTLTKCTETLGYVITPSALVNESGVNKGSFSA